MFILLLKLCISLFPCPYNNKASCQSNMSWCLPEPSSVTDSILKPSSVSVSIPKPSFYCASDLYAFLLCVPRSPNYFKFLRSHAQVERSKVCLSSAVPCLLSERVAIAFRRGFKKTDIRFLDVSCC